MNDMVCRLRPFGGLDLDHAAALHAACFVADWDQKWDRQAFAELLAMPGAFGLMAMPLQDEAPVGLLLARNVEQEAEILTLCVLARWRRRGIGGQLLRAAEREAASRGARRLFLEAAEDNFAARKLYVDVGFRQVGRRAGYYSRGSLASAAALVMAKDIAPHADS